MKSTIHNCPNCGEAVDIDVEYSEDEEFGESVDLRVSCSRCSDSRTTDLIMTGSEVEDLVASMKT